MILITQGAVHNGTNSCALCRAPLPRHYIFHPEVLSQSSSSEENSAEEAADDRWYYEGKENCVHPQSFAYSAFRNLASPSPWVSCENLDVSCSFIVVK